MKRVILWVGLSLLLSGLGLSGETSVISHQQLIEDTRELARTIENVHPDPYVRGGGKIAFHRRLQDVMASIPDSGMTARDFGRLVEPFVAAVGDGHTALEMRVSPDPYAPGGIPLYFEAADTGLFVAFVMTESHRDLIGARLLSVEGVSFDDLVARYRLRRGADNQYLLSRNLGTQGVLWQGDQLRDMLPEWTRTDSIRVGLRLADGVARTIDLAIPEKIDYAAVVYPPMADPALVMDLMSTMQRTDIFYRFLDSTRQTCLLVIHDLSTYREAFEAWRALKITAREPQARAQYQRYHGVAAPTDYDSVVAGLPAATEIFRAMVEEMKAAGTTNLLVDLSQNTGGSSLLGNILLYYLYGKETLLSQKGRTSEIVKYSPEFFEVFPTPSLAAINEGRDVALIESDYDLSTDHAHHGYPGRDFVERELEEVVAWMPTFRAEYDSGDHDRYYTPERILVLCDAGTFSAAFFVMHYLQQAGAETVGIPSAQAGNCFGDIVNFRLPNSGVKYHVSRKYFELYPDDPERGRVLMPDHLMTYDVMASYRFDPAALLWFALDVLGNK